MALTLGDSTTYVQALIDAGADAQTNLFYLQFLSNTEHGFIDSELSTMYTVRATQLTLPTFTHTSKENSFFTTSMKVPVAEITGDKQFSITFRIDSNYRLYQELLKQQAVTSIPNLAYAATELSEEHEAIVENGEVKNLGFKVRIYALNHGVNNTKYETPLEGSGSFMPGPSGSSSVSGYQLLYEFRYCWIEKLSPLKFDFNTADKQTIQCDINFMDFSDPQNLLFTDAELGVKS